LEELYNSIEHFQKAKEFGSYGSHARKGGEREEDARHRERDDGSSYEEKEVITKKGHDKFESSFREKQASMTIIILSYCISL
jgi:hypothetical protein